MMVPDGRCWLLKRRCDRSHVEVSIGPLGGRRPAEPSHCRTGHAQQLSDRPCGAVVGVGHAVDAPSSIASATRFCGPRKPGSHSGVHAAEGALTDDVAGRLGRDRPLRRPCSCTLRPRRQLATWTSGKAEEAARFFVLRGHSTIQHLSDGLAADGRCGHGGSDPFVDILAWSSMVCTFRLRRLFDQTAMILPLILLHQIGIMRLHEYHRYVTPSSSLDAWIRSAYCGTSKDVFSRAMTAKFVLEQLAVGDPGSCC